MNNSIEKLINEYFDNELGKNEETYLFSTLSEDEDAREYFKKLNVLRAAVNESAENFSPDIEERVFYSIQNKVQAKRKFFSSHNLFAAASYAFTIILLVISIILFNKVNNYKEEMDSAAKTISAKSETIELLLQNTLPAAEVRAKLPNEIIIKTKM